MPVECKGFLLGFLLRTTHVLAGVFGRYQLWQTVGCYNNPLAKNTVHIVGASMF
jgi:hypothetical protein